jgi:hypothetical protein
MCLPTIIIFERHWDTIPKLVVQQLLPALADHGYTALCVESGEQWTTDEIIAEVKNKAEFASDLHNQAQNLLHNANIYKNLSDEPFGSLMELMRLYVSSQRYVEVAEHIKHLPATQVYAKIMEQVKTLPLQLKGVDDGASLSEILQNDFLSRTNAIGLKEEKRINAMFTNLCKQEGGIFICGALHADNLVKKFAKAGLQERVLYYFLHSHAFYENEFNDVAKCIQISALLQGHTHLLQETEVASFAKRVLSEVVPKIGYKREILEPNSHKELLNKKFSSKFQLFLRPGYYVDALVDVEKNRQVEVVKKSCEAAGIQTRETSHEGRQFLVIPSVNTKAVAEKLQAL